MLYTLSLKYSHGKRSIIANSSWQSVIMHSKLTFYVMKCHFSLLSSIIFLRRVATRRSIELMVAAKASPLARSLSIQLALSDRLGQSFRWHHRGLL